MDVICICYCFGRRTFVRSFVFFCLSLFFTHVLRKCNVLFSVILLYARSHSVRIVCIAHPLPIHRNAQRQQTPAQPRGVHKFSFISIACCCKEHFTFDAHHYHHHHQDRDHHRHPHRHHTHTHSFPMRSDDDER